MARIRTIKPEFWTDSRMVALSPEARLLYIGLWNFADDSGVLENDPVSIRMQVFPGNDYPVADLLDELVNARRLERYVTPDGVKVLVIPRFLDHQKISHPAPPRFGDTATFTEDSGGLQSVPGTLAQECILVERNRKECPPAKAVGRFDEFWTVYPLKKSKGDAEKAYKSATKEATEDEIIAGATRYANDRSRNPHYTKHPGSWLRAKAWLDELPPTGTTGEVIC